METDVSHRLTRSDKLDYPHRWFRIGATGRRCSAGRGSPSGCWHLLPVVIDTLCQLWAPVLQPSSFEMLASILVHAGDCEVPNNEAKIHFDGQGKGSLALTCSGYSSIVAGLQLAAFN